MTDFTPTVTLPSWARTIVAASARKLMTAAAASLVTWGAIDHDQATQVVTIGSGLLLFLASYAWTWAKERIARERLAHAVASPAAKAIDHEGYAVAVPTADGPVLY